MSAIHRDEWLAELERVAREHPDPGGVTAQEIADATGISTKTVRGILAQAMQRGKWEMAGKRAGLSIDGRQKFAPCYRPVRA